jgi:hypothetical protein
MEDNILFSCENIIVIPNKLLSYYSNITRLSKYFNHEPGVVVLVSDKMINRENLNNVDIIAYAVLVFKKKKVKIVKLAAAQSATTGATHQHAVPLEVVLRYLLDFIKKNFFKSILVKVDSTDIHQINFYIENGFIRIPQKSTTTKIYLMYTTYGDAVFAEKPPSVNNIVANTEINTQLVKVPTSLAKILSKFVQLNHEVGGNICIDYIEQKNLENVLVLGLTNSGIVKGESSNVSFPYSYFSPFSFHTHPDITIVIDSVQRYISWPSGLDIKSILDAYSNKINVLAHFVITTEGIWVIHFTVAFQKFLSNLAVFYKNDLIDIINNIGDIYAEVEKYRTTNFIDPIYRDDIKKDFIDKSNMLTIKDLISVQQKHYIGDNFYLFKLKLLSWNSLKKDRVLKFPYFIAPEAGLPAKISSTCGRM